MVQRALPPSGVQLNLSRTPDGDSAVDLATMTELAGCANRKLLAKAIAWALANQALLQAEWNQLNGD